MGSADLLDLIAGLEGRLGRLTDELAVMDVRDERFIEVLDEKDAVRDEIAHWRSFMRRCQRGRS